MIPDPHDHNADGIIDDDKILAIKGKIMDRLKVKNVYDAVNKVATVAGTLITTATAGAVLSGMMHGGAMVALTLAMSNPVILGLAALGATLMGVAVATDYISSYIGQSANFDIQDTAAQSTARHIRTELEAAHQEMAPAPQAQANQKNWAAAENEKLKLQQQTTSQRG